MISTVFGHALCAVVAAADPSPADHARAEYEAGARAYELGEYEDALSAFKRAYRSTGHAALLFNVAQCQRKLGDDAAAIDTFRAYLHRLPDAANRAEVEGYIAALEAERRAASGDAGSKQPSPAGAPVDPPGSNATASTHSNRSAPLQPRPLSPVAVSAPADRRSWYASPWAWSAAGIVVAGLIVTVLLFGRSESRDPPCEVGRIC